jgi:dynein heavy chain
MILYWRKRREMCYTTPFLELDMEKVIRSINKTSRYFEEKIAKYPLLKEKSKILSQVILIQTKETSVLINFLKNLKNKSLKQRHWSQIFTIIKAPHLKTSQKFTIINLREVHIQNYMEEINKIIEQADLEMRYENIISKIEKQWDVMKLKIIPYAHASETFILSEVEMNFETIEEHLTTLETVRQSKNASHVKERIEEWIKNLIVMRENLTKWIEAQNNWIYLEPIFASPEIQASLPKAHVEFIDLQATLKRIQFSAYLNPKAIYNLVVNNRIDKFESLINYFSSIKKHVDNYLEARRLKYPRFFFMSDSDFLEFLVKAGSKDNIDKFIHKLFPGAASLQFIK